MGLGILDEQSYTRPWYWVVWNYESDSYINTYTVKYNSSMLDNNTYIYLYY
jgi:hypothetical protein